MEEGEYKKAYSVYNQVFGTPHGIQVLADLKRKFYDIPALPGMTSSFEFTAGCNYVIGSILEIMKLADKRAFANIIREIELTEPIGKET